MSMLAAICAAVTAFLSDPSKVPVEFAYDGKFHRGLGGLEIVENTMTPTGGVWRMRLDATVEVRLVARAEAAFDELEYVLWFENNGSVPSAEIRNPWALAGSFAGAKPVLRGILGDHVNGYAPYEQDLERADRYFLNKSGRATHETFPYFDLVHGDGGTLIALGWAGTWEAIFSSVAGETSVRLRSGYNWHLQLLPGEKVRTGLVVLVDYDGRDPDSAMNKWRRWFVAKNMPRANVRGDPVEPFSTVCFANDTGLPNSDGSISERSFTWKPTLDKLVLEKVIPDYRWFDAGWYLDTDGHSVAEDWWGRIGSWELDPGKWPGDTLRESNAACRAAGMKGAFCWFESERTCDLRNIQGLVDRWGYRRKWALENPARGGHVVNDLGDEACRRWTFGRIVSAMEKGGFDIYREDFNTDPEPAWWLCDKRESKELGISRFGMAENRIVQGHYRLWDDILAWSAAHGKPTFLDSCASGGGRNDIESLRRAIPFLRSDADRTGIPLRLGMTTAFCRWIPFTGAACKETVNALLPSVGKGPDLYVFRASYLPILNLQEAFSRNRELDWSAIRRGFEEWKSIRHLLIRDFYPLCPWHHASELRDWAAFAYDWPERGESVLLAFRLEKCERETFVAKLKFADPEAEYEVTDADTGVRRRMKGSVLRSGFPVRLSRPRSSALLRIHHEH